MTLLISGCTVVIELWLDSYTRVLLSSCSIKLKNTKVLSFGLYDSIQ